MALKHPSDLPVTVLAVTVLALADLTPYAKNPRHISAGGGQCCG